MLEHEIPKEYRYEYSKKCEVCDMESTLLTQNDNYPEYDTDVYLRCTCGNHILFELPVN